MSTKKVNKKMTKKEKHIFLNKVIVWANKEEPEKLSEWKKIVNTYLTKCWGWNAKAAKDFYLWGEGGGFNNKLLHVNSTIEDFYGEVHYCSDRMSLDRLFRCHVMFRTINRRVLMAKCPSLLSQEDIDYLKEYPNEEVE